MAGKQAVLLIHGIGEQRPMETLRGFVNTVWRDDNSVHHEHAPGAVWSKPDSVSENYELRRLTTATNRGGLRTDFFEFYWAHRMHGTRWTHVFAWMRTLLLRKPWTVPPHLRSLYAMLVFSILVAAFLFLRAAYVGTSTGTNSGIQAVTSVIFGVAILPAVGYVLRWIVGDAARYLDPAPANIQRRAEIRHAGVELLRELHRRDYDRIIVVGHSLGTVIGYDVLKYTWSTMHTDFSPDANSSGPDAGPLEAMAQAGEAANTDEIRVEQRCYLNSLVAAGHPWRVTDFVTLGSPLAHAELLLAKDRSDLEMKQANRELPTSLPELETSAGGISAFTFKLGVKRSNGKTIRISVPHHAAVFAATRWTNLYFPCKHIVFGDLIAGPLCNVFGHGVQDVPITTKIRSGLLSHTLYWTEPKEESDSEHIVALRHALDLADDHREKGVGQGDSNDKD